MSIISTLYNTQLIHILILPPFLFQLLYVRFKTSVLKSQFFSLLLCLFLFQSVLHLEGFEREEQKRLKQCLVGEYQLPRLHNQYYQLQAAEEYIMRQERSGICWHRSIGETPRFIAKISSMMATVVDSETGSKYKYQISEYRTSQQASILSLFLYIFRSFKCVVVKQARYYNCNNIPIRYNEVTKQACMWYIYITQTFCCPV